MEWNPDWETQNLHNGLFTPDSDATFVDLTTGMDSPLQPGQPSPSEEDSRDRSGESTQLSDIGLAIGEPLEFSPSLRQPTSPEAATTSGRISDISNPTSSKHERKILGELHVSNKRIREADGETQVSKAQKTMGGIAPNSILSANKALQMRWRNGVFCGWTSSDLYSHCNGILSESHRFIHDIVPDPDGSRIDQLLDQLSSTRKSNGL